jgi:HEAT repeat protein
VQTALRHSDESVRREGLNVVRRMDHDKAVHVMMHALGDDDDNLVLSALAYFGELKWKNCVVEVMKLVEKGRDERIRKEACLALGKIGDEKALSLLLRVVDYRPGATRIFGLGGAYTDDIRAAAAWALGSFQGNDTVRAVLERAVQDKSAAVRSAAKLSLRT